MKFSHFSFYEDLPDEKEVICEENLKLFFKTMFERQEVWYKRFILKQDRPWTDDPILNNNKFTNVYRELDRSSQFQIKNVFRGKFSSVNDLIWKVMFYRIFNSPDFFSWIENQNKFYDGMIPKRKEYKADDFLNLMHKYRETGGNPFTNAYLINSQACPGEKRDFCYAKKVVPTLKQNFTKLLVTLKKAETPEEIINELKKLPAVSDFIAHEFYQDFTYAPRYSNLKIMNFDQDDFTNVGPGAAIGIRLIFPSLKNQKEGIYYLRDLAASELKKIGDFKYLKSDGNKYFTDRKANITLHQIEMWLCEFQKYWKMKIGKGKQRSQFQPKTKTL